jgi:hypothetical protein
MNETVTLAEAYLKEQERCRELLTAYKQIGSAGIFGHTMISEVLQRADRAVMEGNTVAMMRLYEEMKGCQ